jgi:hypothetical protein
MKDPVIASNQSPLINHSNLPKAVSEPAQLSFNILPFSHPEETKEFTFSVSGNTCKYRFWIKKLPGESVPLFTQPDPQKPFVYTNFDTVSPGTLVKIDFSKQRAIARAWYTLKIRDFLQPTANVTVTNFLNDCQYWLLEKDVNNSLYDVYRKFTIRVQNDHRFGTPELLISFDGKAYVLKKSLARLTENASFDTSVLESVLYRGQLYPYDRDILKAAWYHQDEIFPLISKKNMGALKVSLPAGINRQKLLSSYNEITAFYNEYLASDEFRRIIPHEAKWKTAHPADVNRLTQTGRDLVFGEGHVSADIFGGLKANGPYLIPGYKHTKIFMVYRESDLPAALKLKEYIEKREGFGSLGAFTRIPFEYDPGLDIVLKDGANSADQVHEIIQNRTANPDCGYFAFYISPYTRFETQPANHEIYFKIKKIMLRRGIGLQVIERGKLFGNFAYSIANIGIAMIAKMGGIPWRLARTPGKELLIGFGAFKSKRYNTQFVGSSLCFSSDGTFQEFNCFPADETWSIAGSAEEALIAYRRNNPDVKRMVIHFYQKISRKQLKPIEDMLRKLNFDIPVIVVRINKTFSRSQLVFEKTYSDKMPLNGSYIHLGRNEYLFCNNQRENEGSTPASLPLPLKIGLQSNREGLLNDAALVERLMMQVYEFSFMHWRSVNQPNLPVTITYPEMLAKIFPFLGMDTIPEERRKNLFFL